MTLIQSVTLGIIQGLTEFLPISSSAHLVLVPRLLGWQNLNHQNSFQLSFDIALHLASFLALIVFFRKDLINLARSPENNRLRKALVIGSIPAFVAGFLFSNFFESLFGSAKITASLLLVTGLILMMAEYTAKLTRNYKSLGIKDGFIIGLAQTIAIAPGISRSGATISAGLMLGLNRQAAARFSFLLAIPAVFGAFIFSLKDVQMNMLNSTLLFGFVASFVFSYLAIKFLLRYLQRGSLKVFAVYCLIAGLLGVVLL